MESRRNRHFHRSQTRFRQTRPYFLSILFFVLILSSAMIVWAQMIPLQKKPIFRHETSRCKNESCTCQKVSTNPQASVGECISFRVINSMSAFMLSPKIGTFNILTIKIMGDYKKLCTHLHHFLWRRVGINPQDEARFLCRHGGFTSGLLRSSLRCHPSFGSVCKITST